MTALAAEPTVAVIVVSANTAPLLRACLHSVDAAARYAGLPARVWVVDNASTDGSAELVAAEFPHVRLLPLRRNIGFAGANNLALAHLGFDAPVPPDLPVTPPAPPPDYVLLLNPDAELTVGALRGFVRVMAALPQAGVVGAYLQYGDGSFQHGAFRFPGTAQVALDLFPLTGVRGAHRLHDSALNGRYPRSRWEQPDPFAVDFVLGAAMFVRAAAIRDVGVFDPIFWLYCEEMDWCLRMHERGWGVHAAPGVRVIHHAAQSSRQVRWRAYSRLWQSRFAFYARHRSRYGFGHLLLVRGLLRLSIARRRGEVEAAFARGELSGAAAAEALHALRIVAQL